jgi:hypothetical protein
MELKREWHPFDDGATVHGRGSEAGIIVIDEEYAGAARITLERDETIAPSFTKPSTNS